MRVISLGLSSVNRFCSTDWFTAKCVKVVYRSVHIFTSSLVCKYFLSVKHVSVNYFTKGFIIVIKKPFPSKAVARYAISHCGDSIEGKLVTAVDELKGPDCGNATEETEKDAEVEKSDYVDEDTNDLDKLKLSKKRPKELFEHDERWQIITKGSKQPSEDATDETLVCGLNKWVFRIF
jgi:hypothetical protein